MEIKNILNNTLKATHILSADFTQRKSPNSPGNTKLSLLHSKRVGNTYGLPVQLPPIPRTKAPGIADA